MTDLLTLSQIATLLGVNRSTVWRWYRDDKLPEPVLVGMRLKWHKSDILAFAANR